MIETISVFGTNVSLYYTFWLIGAVAVFIGGVVLGREQGYGFSKSILYVAGTVALGYLLLWVTSWIFGGGKLIGLNFVRIATFLPVPIYLLTKLQGDPFGKTADYLAPLVAIFHGVTHLGCIFEGCCHGYAASWGLYSNEVGAVCFPIQPIEALSSILIAVVLLVMRKHNRQEGRLYAWYLLLYGGTRFLWEFLRDNEKIWHGISELAFHALGAFVVGLAALAVLQCLAKKEQRHEKA